jgi:hypothetical protein
MEGINAASRVQGPLAKLTVLMFTVETAQVSALYWQR